MPHSTASTSPDRQNTPYPGSPTALSSTQNGPVRGVFTGIPSRTAALIRNVQRGGARSYLDVGRQVGLHLCANVPVDLENNHEWLDILHREVIQVIQGLTALPNDEAWHSERYLSPLREWLTNHFPGITTLIPSRHHLKFTEGFVQGVLVSGDWRF